MTLTHNTAPMIANLRAHIKADALTRNVGYAHGRGCFIGCAERTYDPQLIFKRRGIPMPVTGLGEVIFEGYSETLEGQVKAANFTQRYADAICDGLDLSLMHWSLLRDILADIPKSNSKDVNESVAESLRIMALLAAGSEPESLRATTYVVGDVALAAVAAVAAWTAVAAVWTAHETAQAAHAAALVADIPRDDYWDIQADRFIAYIEGAKQRHSHQTLKHSPMRQRRGRGLLTRMVLAAIE